MGKLWEWRLSVTQIHGGMIGDRSQIYRGEVALTTNEYKTAERLKQDYWLYVVFNCAANPEIHVIQNSVKLGWEPIVKIEHYYIGAAKILNAQTIIEK